VGGRRRRMEVAKRQWDQSMSRHMEGLLVITDIRRKDGC
jgi:hypothetical protein